MLSPLQLQLLLNLLQATLHLPAGKRAGCQQQLSLLQSAAEAAISRPCLHPTTKDILPQCTTVHTFSGNANLCYAHDEVSRKYFLQEGGCAIPFCWFGFSKNVWDAGKFLFHIG
jgi:hypothetical protein